MPVTSEGPVAAASTQDHVVGKLAAFISRAVQESSDGLTVAEFGDLLISLLRLTIAQVDAFTLPGSDKKALVLQAAGDLFDAVADKLIPLPAIPLWWIVRPAVRSLVLALASGAIESLLPLVRAS